MTESRPVHTQCGADWRRCERPSLSRLHRTSVVWRRGKEGSGKEFAIPLLSGYAHVDLARSTVLSHVIVPRTDACTSFERLTYVEWTVSAIPARASVDLYNRANSRPTAMRIEPRLIVNSHVHRLNDGLWISERDGPFYILQRPHSRSHRPL